jgi:hypothetical protein
LRFPFLLRREKIAGQTRRLRVVKVTIEANRAVAGIKLDRQSAMLMPRLEGRKTWLKTGALSFELTPNNERLFNEVYGEVEWVRPDAAPALSVDTSAFDEIVLRPFRMKKTPFGHQQTAFDLCKDLPYFALFMDQGTGKTKVAIDKAGYLWCKRKITGVLMVSLNGVHRQWAEVALPEHMSDQVEWRAYPWSLKGGKANLIARQEMHKTDKLAFFCTYIQAVANGASFSAKGVLQRVTAGSGFEACRDFIKAHKGRVLMVIDESQTIKTPGSIQARAAKYLGDMCDERMILTGTPQSKDVMDLWSQYQFLSEKIIGFRYATAFKKEFCIIGGFTGRDVIGTKNVDDLQRRIAPYTYRVTKEEALDLPPKLYGEWLFDMTAEQRKHYQSLKQTFMTQLDNGQIASVTHAATLFLRLQQITCGTVTADDGTVTQIPDGRLDALVELLEARDGKAVIWARFNDDIDRICAKLGPQAVAYYGDTREDERKDAVKVFSEPASDIRYFVSNPAAGGTGVDGLQHSCSTAVYYSNSFMGIHRWQSEDRLHRIGTKFNVEIIDMICRGGVDRKIIKNLKQKRDLADLVLSDFRKMLDDDE